MFVIGAAAVICGMALLWVFVRRHGRAMKDSVALIVGGVFLTLSSLGVLVWLESLPIARTRQWWIGRGLFLAAAIAFWWLLNTHRKSGSPRVRD